MESRRIFVGGTGRSGTSLLLRIIGGHPQIHALASEVRILTDHDGLLPLIDAHSTRYTQVRAREGMHRFERLVKYDINTPERTPYEGYMLRDQFGKQYDKLIDKLISDLTIGSFEERVGQRSFEEAHYWTGERSKWTKSKVMAKDYMDNKSYVGKFFTDRKEIEGIAGRFVEDLFSIPMREAGKQTWCEKTPANLDNMLDLQHVFPEALFIHIKRDPRGVCHSLMNQVWAPSDMELTVNLLKQLYKKWFYIKDNLPANAKVIEISLEDLTANPEPIMTRIAAEAGVVDEWPALAKLNRHKANYWIDKIGEKNIQKMNGLFGDYIEKMGYSLEL